MDYSSSERTNNSTLQSDEIFEKYSSLKFQYNTLHKKFEECQQQLYESKKNHQIATELKEHLTSELEMWQRNENKIKEECAYKIQTLQEEIEQLRQEKWKEAEQYNSTIETLQLKIKSLEVDEKAAVHESSIRQMDNSRSTEEYKRVEEENFALKDMIEEQKEQLVKHLATIEDFKVEIVMRKESEESLKINLDNKKEELASVTEMLHSVQNDLCEANFQLQTVKQQSSGHAVKGNSLFAEVDDKRQEMLKSYSQMKDKVLQLNRELKSKQAELDSLLCEKKSLWEEYSGQAHHHDAVLNRAYERRITDLEKENDQLHREIAAWYSVNLDPNSSTLTRWISGVLDYYRDENQRLSDNFAANSVDNLNKEEKIRDLQRQIVVWRTKAMEANATISQLQTMKLVEKQISDVTINDSMKRSARKDTSAVFNKENISQNANMSLTEPVATMINSNMIKINENENESFKKPGILVTGSAKSKPTTKKASFQS